MAPAVTDGIKITAGEPAEACEHAAAISAQQGVRGGTMTQGGGGAGSILRGRVPGFAGETGANPERGGIQKGPGTSEQKGTFPVTWRGIK